MWTIIVHKYLNTIFVTTHELWKFRVNKNIKLLLAFTPYKASSIFSTLNCLTGWNFTFIKRYFVAIWCKIFCILFIIILFPSIYSCCMHHVNTIHCAVIVRLKTVKNQTKYSQIWLLTVHLVRIISLRGVIVCALHNENNRWRNNGKIRYCLLFKQYSIDGWIAFNMIRLSGKYGVLSCATKYMEREKVRFVTDMCVFWLLPSVVPSLRSHRYFFTYTRADWYWSYLSRKKISFFQKPFIFQHSLLLAQYT